MNRLWLAAIFVAGTVLLGGCNKPITVPSSSPSLEVDLLHGHLLGAQARLPTVDIRIIDGGEMEPKVELTVEIARKPVEIGTGMMFRTNMTDSEGMLFVFPDASKRSFYMKNCVVPLSAAYIDPSGVILETIDMKPFDETGIPSASGNIQFVLEVPQGWFQRHNVKAGAVVRTERGDLQQTFFGN